MFTLSLDWWELVIRGLVIYVFLIVLLRLTGKRQIGEISPFDLVLLLILSNAVENSMTGGEESLLGGMIIATTLIIANFFVGYITHRSKRIEAIIEGRPQVLIHEGKMFKEVMDEAKLTRLELDTSLRQQGYFNVSEVKLAILENNGMITVQGYDKKQKQPSSPE